MSRVLLALVAAALLLPGCAANFPRREVRQSASVVEYLYPKADEAPKLEPGIAILKPPVKVGIAFVPSAPRPGALPEPERAKLLARMKSSFEGRDFIGRIEVIPTAYLRPGGGFDNLAQVARMFDVDVVALVSHDQVRFNDSNALAVLYWTLVGAYVVNGDEYDIHTMIDVSVFDVASRRLLLRAPGTSRVGGSANLANYGERTRLAQADGYEKAVAEAVPRLDSELDGLKARIRAADPGVRVENRPGYKGGSAFDAGSLAFFAALAAFAWMRRRGG
jgi:rhombotail lipoprotein